MNRRDWATAFKLAAPGQDRKRLYQIYIRSSAWQQSTARLQCINRAQGRCEVCNRKGRHVHHITYKNIGNESPNDLLYVCLSCHEYLHNPSSKGLS